MKKPSEISLFLKLASAIALLGLVSIHPAHGALWVTNGPMNTARYYHTATLLPNGKVLIAGGYDNSATSLASTELFDPATGLWSATGDMNEPRSDHAATMLANGQVLVTGGFDFYFGINYGVVASAELFNPATENWAKAGSMVHPHRNHTATLLLDGRVLVAGGYGDNNAISSAELYDPATGMWQATDSLKTARSAHTATGLPDGRVLIAGGMDSNSIPLATTELYSPVTGSWTNAGPLNHARYGHTATLLPNGLVLVVGGSGDGNLLSSAELFDPTTGTWTQTTTTLTTARIGHRATLLPDGKVLLAGGYAVGFYAGALGSVEVYDPVTGLWTTNSPLADARGDFSATLLANGKVLVAGGYGDGGDNFLNTTEIYDPAINPATGTWTNTGAMTVRRFASVAVLLTNGQVLVAGGFNSDNDLSSAELYNPSNGTWRATGPMKTQRAWGHTLTLLPNGNVLAAGGQDSSFYNSEVYDPRIGSWSANFYPMKVERTSHTATLLPNGKVLVAGGYSSIGSVCASAELYNSGAKTWTLTGTMGTGRYEHTATLLPNGKVLVAGGDIINSFTSSATNSAELYDPVMGLWTKTGAMNVARDNHTATLLPNGKVLVAGGGIANSVLATNSAELYDPATGQWTITGSMNVARDLHRATLLPNGRVLVTGGNASNGAAIATSELYDPAIGTWSLTSSLTTSRWDHVTALLANGKILVAGGGHNPTNDLSNSELYDAGLGNSNSWQPRITAATSPLNLGGSLVVTGAQFHGIAEGSSGNTQDSAADYPLVQLRSLENGQTTFLLTTNWSTNSVTSTGVWNFPPGWALATVFVNGIPSTSAIVNISVPAPAVSNVTCATAMTGGTFQFCFTNSAGGLFGVLATTNLSLPLTDWTALGGVVEVAPGQFQFNDPQGTMGGQRFYRLYAP